MAAVKQTDQEVNTLTETELRRKGCDVLRLMAEPGALLVVASNMDKAVIVKDRDGAGPTRTKVVDKELAEALALKGWIQCHQRGRLARYSISPSGRDALGHLMAEVENAASGFAEMKPKFKGKAAVVQLHGDDDDS